MQEQDYILFENYLSGSMEVSDIQAFEGRLKSDADFNRAFNDYKQAESFLEHKFHNQELTQSFVDNLEQISLGYFANEPVETKTIRFKPWYYSVAAAVVILFGIMVKQQFSQPTYDDFANYGTLHLTVRGGEAELPAQAEQAFNQKDYRAASGYLSQLLQNDRDNIELKLYLAVCLVELNTYGEADKLYQEIMHTPSVYADTAKWYLALSKLKQDKKAETLQILKSIHKEADVYETAQKLLRKLD